MGNGECSGRVAAVTGAGSGMSPEKVARTAVRCLGRRRLPPRKPVGVFCSVLCALNRVLPHRAVLFLLHRLYAS